MTAVERDVASGSGSGLDGGADAPTETQPPAVDREALAKVLAEHDEAAGAGEFLAEVDFTCCADAIIASGMLRDAAEVWDEGNRAAHGRWIDSDDPDSPQFESIPNPYRGGNR